MASSLILALLLPAMGVQHIELLGSVPPEATGPVDAPRVNVWLLLMMCGIGGFGLWTVATLQAAPPATGGTVRRPGSNRRRRARGHSRNRLLGRWLPPWLGRRRRRRLRG